MANWKSIASRIRGLSFSLTGGRVSLQAPRPESEIAQTLIAFLEVQRVLFDDAESEIPATTVASVHDIRKQLTTLLQGLPNRRGLPQHLRVLRGACRQFLSKVEDSDGQPIIKNSFEGGPAAWVFFTALGELRSTFGLHLAIIAARYKLGIEGGLARILPPPPDDEDTVDPVRSDRFRQLTAEWKEQSEFLSSPSAIAGLPAYQSIIDMGPAAVPLILRELRRQPDHWFVALRRITGADPVPEESRGNINRMADAWDTDFGRHRFRPG